VEPADSFFAAAERALPVLGAPEVAAAWQSPSALEGYTVASLAGHLVRATGRTETILGADPPTAARLLRPAEYLGRARIDDPEDRESDFQRAVRDDGRRAGQLGPDALTAEFAALIGRLRVLLEATSLERPVAVLTVPGAATSLGDYLRTRVVELVVHTDDLAVSAGLAPPALGDGPATVAIGVLVELARAHHGDAAVLTALARAERAEPGALRAI